MDRPSVDSVWCGNSMMTREAARMAKGRGLGWRRLMTCVLVSLCLVGCSPSKKRVMEAILERTGVEWVTIHPGTFVRDGQEVRIDHAFEMTACEITRAQWFEVVYQEPYYGDDGDKPETKVAWKDVELFCRALRAGDGRGYRLPDRDEWEYACRAGSTTKYYWGDAFDDRYAWCWENSHGEPKQVRQTTPNAWGLYDMCGNADELCTDPSTPGGKWFFVMGGGADDRSKYCNCGNVAHQEMYLQDPTNGFRVVRELDDE